MTKRNIGDTKVGGRAVCDYCKKAGTETNPLVWDEDPYAADINDDHTPCWMHSDCRDESAQDI